MTLVVYKNNMLAADTRATVGKGVLDENDHCAHCGEEAHVVTDGGCKITLPKKDQEIKFRGSRVLAVGQAGYQALSKRLVSAFMSGKDIEEIYRGYVVIHGPTAHNENRSSLLICCEDCNYVVGIPQKGELKVEKANKDDVVAIGSDLKVVEWLNVLMPDASAAALINLVMAKNKMVGGPIKEVTLTDTPPTIKDYEKKDPAKLLEGTVEIFKTGLDTVKASGAKPRRARKPAPKAPA